MASQREQARGDGADHRLVVDDEKTQGAAGAGGHFARGLHDRCRVVGDGGLWREREDEAEDGALAERALDLDPAAVLLDDALSDGQPHPRTVRPFRREEGLEDAPEHPAGMPTTSHRLRSRLRSVPVAFGGERDGPAGGMA